MGEDLGWVLERMPHKPPMLLVDEVVSVEGPRITVKAHISPDHILLEDGAISPLLAIELFAQAAAALMVHRSAQHGAGMESGYLLGTRKLELEVDAFHVGDELVVRAEELWGADALSQLDCTLERGGKVVAKGSINVARG
jgi:predicted hotdog family 3-hydroxylacyl-ACP dehydratase